ncbi:MAG: O-antigen ligase [Flammeovirgaceae bacterium]|jgi:O-antigen ligase
MIELYKSHKKVLFIFLVWLIAGKFGGTIVGMVVSSMALIYFWNKKQFATVFIGLLMLAVFAGGSSFPFAKPARNIYMLEMCILMLVSNLDKIIAVDVFYKKLGLFFLYSLPLLLLSPTILISFQKNISFILLYICVPPLFLSVMQHSKKEFMELLLILLFTVFAGGLVLYLINPSVALRVGRYKGLFGNPNEIGLFCVMSFILITTIRELMREKEIVTRFTYNLLYILIFINLFLCGSRGSMLGLSIFFLIWFSRLGWVASLFIFATIGVLYGLVFENITYIVQVLGFEEYFRLNSLDMAGGRIHGWAFAWEEVHKSFIFGRGWVYDEYIFKIHAPELNELNHQGGVHNSYLGIWLNTGIIGLLLFLTGLIRLFVKASQINRIAIAAFFCFLVTAFFEPWMQSSLNITSVIMVMFLTVVIFASDIFPEKNFDDSIYLDNEESELLNKIKTI